MPRLVSRPRSWPGAIMRLKRGEKRRSETSRSTGAPPSMGDEPGSVAPTSRLPESAAEHNSNIATGSSCSPRCQPDTGHGGLLAHVLTSRLVWDFSSLVRVVDLTGLSGLSGHAAPRMQWVTRLNSKAPRKEECTGSSVAGGSATRPKISTSRTSMERQPVPHRA